MSTTIPTHPALVWPRSDGDNSRYPTHRTPGPAAWFEPVSETHPKYSLYEEAAGEHLASILNLPKLVGKSHRINFPEGYKMFVHKQPRPDGNVREDFYVFGSKYQLRIRSGPEWKEHAAWLFDTTKQLENHNRECGCCRKKQGTAAGPSTSTQTTPVKRSVPGPTKPKTQMKKPKPQKPESDDESPTGVIPDRASDLGMQRRFRRGELVYFRMETINPPQLSLPAITHWPALISDIRFKSTTSAVGGGSMGNGGTVHHYWEYHLRPLGMFDKRQGLVKDVKDILPWAVGYDLFDGERGRDALAIEAQRILAHGIETEQTMTKWEDKWGRRRLFGQMEWEEAAFRLVVSIKQGSTIAKSWCQTDRIDIIPEAILSEPDRSLIASGKKALFQGLWLGGERIWAEDVVRLKHNRRALPPGLTPLTVGSHAEQRAVVFRIQAIALEHDYQVEVTGENETTKVDTWRCLLYGDVAELVDATPGMSVIDSGWTPTATSNSMGITQPLVQNYKAPKGFAYRQINTDDSQVTCDIGDIAGRLYPDLLDEKTQSWFGKSQGQAVPGAKAWALMGLSPGNVAATENEVWIEDLFAIVDRASKSIEAEFHDYYVSEKDKLRAKREAEAAAAAPVAGAGAGAGAQEGKSGDEGKGTDSATLTDHAKEKSAAAVDTASSNSTTTTGDATGQVAAASAPSAPVSKDANSASAGAPGTTTDSDAPAPANGPTTATTSVTVA